MKNDDLFEYWRIKIATAISLTYKGEGRDFYYCPNGTEGLQMVESPPFRSLSIVADNESTFHDVALVGPADTTMPDDINSLSRLVHSENG